MACQCAPALVQLRNEINFLWPQRDKASDGCCGDSAHAARKSDHNPTNGYAHALDIDEDLSPNVDLAWLWNTWVKDPDPRIKYLIYEGTITASYLSMIAASSASFRPVRTSTSQRSWSSAMPGSAMASATRTRGRWSFT